MIHSGKKILSVIFAIFVLLNSVFTFNSEAASKKVTVYVVTSIKQDNEKADKFQYTSNGLLKKSKHAKYIYDGKLLKKQIGIGDNKNLYNRTYEYNSKGQVIKHSGPIPFDNEDGSIMTGYEEITYDNKGRISKTKNFEGWYDGSSKISYNKKNKVSKRKIRIVTEKDSHYDTYKYYYDKKGYLRKSIYHCQQMKSSSVTYYKNSYDKNGCVVKIKIKGSYDAVYKLTYKKLKVPASYKKVIEKQQMAIIPSAVSVGTFSSFGK